jgi:hypothetical protein
MRSAADLSTLLKFRKGYFSSGGVSFSFPTIHEIVRPGPEMQLLGSPYWEKSSFLSLWPTVSTFYSHPRSRIAIDCKNA